MNSRPVVRIPDHYSLDACEFRPYDLLFSSVFSEKVADGDDAIIRCLFVVLGALELISGLG